jgi:hypothetical protein
VAQSVDCAQLVLQAPAAQVNGTQLVLEVGTQAPLPSQLDAPSKLSFWQPPAAQGVPAWYRAQNPPPSQRPVWPQLAAPWSVQTPAGSGPAAAAAQFPAPAAHDLQLPQGPLEQQTLSVQKVLRQSVPTVQEAPSGFRFVQEPDWQVSPLMQSPSRAHIVRQAPLPQRNAPQLICGWTQVPLPSQAPTGVSVDPVQVAVPQLVPFAALAHWPLPSQVPSLPQGGFGAQPPCGSWLPAETGWQVPPLPAALQTWQLPQLADEQQTPSTQLPLSHSVPAPQSWPSRLSPQAPLLQNLLGAQSLLPAQTATQAVPLAAQANGAHGWVTAGLQVPLPSQLRASVSVPAEQAGPTHCVPAV